jgi:hypothetical protein
MFIYECVSNTCIHIGEGLNENEKEKSRLLDLLDKNTEKFELNILDKEETVLLEEEKNFLHEKLLNLLELEKTANGSEENLYMCLEKQVNMYLFICMYVCMYVYMCILYVFMHLHTHMSIWIIYSHVYFIYM